MPTNSNNRSFNFKNEKQLIETAGNPNASESEWLDACQNLGAYKPKSARKPSRRTTVIAAIAILVTVGFGTLGISTSQHAQQMPALIPSTVLGRPSLMAQASVDFGPYVADLQRRIKRNWYPPTGHESRPVVVLFKVGSSGELSNLRILRSSGRAKADKAALKAVEHADFRPLPAGASNDVEIQFTFDDNKYGGSRNGYGHYADRSSKRRVDPAFDTPAVNGDIFSTSYSS